MKRVKKAKPYFKKVFYERAQIQCPHCKTFIERQLDDDILKIKCAHCKNPIEIDWENKEQFNFLK